MGVASRGVRICDQCVMRAYAEVFELMCYPKRQFDRNKNHNRIGDSTPMTDWLCVFLYFLLCITTTLSTGVVYLLKRADERHEERYHVFGLVDFTIRPSHKTESWDKLTHQD